MASFLIYWSILLVTLKISHGLICYECTSNDPQNQCVTNNGRIIECSFKFCTLYRFEASTFFFIRNCTDLPMDVPSPPGSLSNFETHEVKSYYRYCSTNFCNDGDGTDDKKSQPIMVVNGMEQNSGAKYLSVNIYLLVISSVYQIFL